MKTAVVFDRVVFDTSGKAIRWERSIDGTDYVQIDWPKDELPFILIKPIERHLTWIVTTTIHAEN